MWRGRPLNFSKCSKKMNINAAMSTAASVVEVCEPEEMRHNVRKNSSLTHNSLSMVRVRKSNTNWLVNKHDVRLFVP